MTDVVNQDTRSRMMSGIRSKNTQPEIAVRRALHSAGMRYRLHVPHLAGRPDIVLRRYNLCIFVHGCFWHRHEGCKFSTTPATRRDFWESKFEQNVLRDRLAIHSLQQQGWRVFILWECGVKKQPLDWLPAAVASGVNWLEWPRSTSESSSATSEQRPPSRSR